ncbi:MAG: IS4 family transposase [Candidatus Delongbacteria bacterium]|nr:IS4 family transposase [Candidatus Delongbacteria bacterium]
MVTHTLLDLHGSIPALEMVTIGRIHDVNTLDQIRIEPGAFYVLDRGYLDFARLYRIHQTGAFFVIRSKSNFDSRRLYSVSVDRTTGVICDQRITPNGQATRKRYQELLRRVRYKDAATGKKLDFLTNNTALPATTICALYKQRWQVELFFKWIKQNLCIRHFLGNSENAVKTQICAQLPICPDCNHQEGTATDSSTLHLPTDSVGVFIRENPVGKRLERIRLQKVVSL